MTTLLSAHFSLEELTITDHREYSNEPNESERQNPRPFSMFAIKMKEYIKWTAS